MGSKTSKLAKKVAKSQGRAISPRERHEKMPTLSTGAPSLRHNLGATVDGVDMKEQDKFRNDWFPNAHWEQYPVRGDIQEMAQEQRSFSNIKADPDPTIPALAEEKDNVDLIRDMTFIGKGLTPGPDKSTQFPRLRRDESKMPKARVSMPEKKLKGYLDASQFMELFEIRQNYSLEELGIKFETLEKQIEDIFRYFSWCDQPSTSTLTSGSDTTAEEERSKKEEKNRARAERLHMPNQGGFTPYEGGTGPDSHVEVPPPQYRSHDPRRD